MATKKKSGGEVRLPERFTVEAAADVLEEIRKAASADEVRIDLSDVAVIDTAGVQLLVVARQGIEAGGKRCAIHSAPETVVDIVRLLGLDQLVELA